MTLFQRIARAIWPPIEPVPRTAPVLFGYYGADDAQIDETRGSVNVLFECGWGGEEAAFARIASAKLRTVLEVTGYLYDREPGQKFTLRADAEQRLTALRDRLAAARILRNINWIAPIDEPDINTNPDDQHAGNMIARRVFSGSKLAVIFAGVSRLTHIEDYDLVGFDDYDKRERIFDITLPWPPQSDYDRLISRLRPDQRVMLVSGGGDPWRQDPAPFVAKARQDGRVAMVLGFLLIERNDCSPPAAGIRDNGMAEAYRTAFSEVK